MKKIIHRRKKIKIISRFLLRLIYFHIAFKLVLHRGYSKIKSGNFPKNYNDLIYYLNKVQAVFEVNNSLIQQNRLENYIWQIYINLISYKFFWWKLDHHLTFNYKPKFSSYIEWRDENYLNKEIIKSITNSAANIENETDILLSIIIPVYKTNPKFLLECIDSVINQIYKNWELIIIDDGSDSVIIKNLLNNFKEKDIRIRVIFLGENQGIVSATNIGLKQANGSYIGFLDHDDLLSCDALFLIAKTILKYPNLDYIYTDEDKIDEKGIHYDPNFKGAYNELMAKFHNYTHHLSFYSSRILFKIGELNQDLNGAQDFDLLLRAQEFLQNENVYHLPYVCYHWRAHSESTASSGSQKKYVLASAKKAINNNLIREGIECELFLPEIAKKYNWTLFQPLWKVHDVLSLVTILIPTKNNGLLLLNCINSIKKTCKFIPKIIIIDDNSDELQSLEIFRNLEKDANLNLNIIKSPFTDNVFNYARLINFGSERITTKYFIQLNNDIVSISLNWIEQMVGWMQFDQIGVVGVKLKYPNGNLQHAGVIIGPNGGLADHQFIGLPGNDHPGFNSLPHISREVSAVTGACLLTDTKLFRSLGGFDEINFAVEFNDVDYCLRVNHIGKKVLYAAQVEMTHITSASRGNSYNPQEHINFLEKYSGYKDIYFSTNINIDSMQMSLFSNNYIYKNITVKPRLVIFSHALSRTGAPITALEFALEMKKRGYKIEFITFEDGPLKSKLYDNDINFHNINLSTDIYNISFDEIFYKINDIFKIIQINKDSDIVICNTSLTFTGITIASTYNVKTIWHIHENTDFQAFISLLRDSELRENGFQALDKVNFIIFQSETTKQVYEKYISSDKIFKINGGMPLDRINSYIKCNDKLSVRRQLGISERCHVISIIGTTCNRKGQKEFLEAIKIICSEKIINKFAEFTILIVGKDDSDYSRSLELQASLISHIDIRIIAEVDNIYDYYLISDTFVCASKEESFPMVVLLAMAFKIPIVSTLVGGIGEMLHDGHDAILTSNYSSEAIKQALFNSLLNMDRDIMSKRAYAKLLRLFDNKKIYDEHENILFYLNNVIYQ